MTKTAWGLIIADGKGQELIPGTDTAFLGVGSRPVIGHVLTAFDSCPDIEGVVVVAPRARIDNVRSLSVRYGCSRLRHVLPGGTQRRMCLDAALAVLDDEVEWVVVHDVSRPCVTSAMISRVLQAAFKCGCAITGERIDGPVKRVKKNVVSGGTWRDGELWLAQSPQAFRRTVLEKALVQARRKKLDLHEESEAVELIGGEVRVVPADRINLRLAKPGDLALAAPLLM